MNENTETRCCKKCGCEFMSTNKKKLCANCSRNQNEKLKKSILTCMSIGVTIGGFYIKRKKHK